MSALGKRNQLENAEEKAPKRAKLERTETVELEQSPSSQVLERRTSSTLNSIGGDVSSFLSEKDNKKLQKKLRSILEPTPCKLKPSILQINQPNNIKKTTKHNKL